MNSNMLDSFDVRAHINAYWLRPESALWDCIAARHLSMALNGKSDIVEIGIGNGFFSFLLFGGKFVPEFDWFYSVNTEGFWANSDIFNHDSGLPLESFVARAPDTRLRLGLDHKQALLSQAARLGFVDRLIQHDCNSPLPIDQTFNTAYSNMLYWLKDPMDAMHNVARLLEPEGQLVTVFPNRDFYRSCTSYTSKDPVWKLLNRGRAEHIMWNMDLSEFEHKIREAGVFELSFSTRYLAPLTLKIWDTGLRPLSVPLIKMAGSLEPEQRKQIKTEWCDTLEKFAEPILINELENGAKAGGFNLVVLKKKK